MEVGYFYIGGIAVVGLLLAGVILGDIFLDDDDLIPIPVPWPFYLAFE